MTDTYCAAPFRHICVTEEHELAFRPCCSWDPHARIQTLIVDEDPMNNVQMQDLRQSMLNNEIVEGCWKCRDREDANGRSLRQIFNARFGRPTDVRLESLEHNLGNLCNLKCRMCYGGASSRWLQDDAKLQRHGFTLQRRKLRNMNLDLSSLRWIKFIGGEPTMEEDEIRDSLQLILEQQGTLSNLFVELNTNATKLLEPDIIQMLMSCKKTLLFCSLDGVGKYNDYQRMYSRWEEVSSVIKQYHAMQNDRFRVSVLSAMGILNVSGTKELIDWVSRELIGSQHEMLMIYGPDSQDIRNLPAAYKKKLLDDIKDWEPRYPSGWTEICKTRIVHALQKESIVPIERVRKHIRILDDIMDTKLHEVFPELYAAIFVD
jgi:sulfatase maturation enzyme AslB (radical SAM superfamily)